MRSTLFNRLFSSASTAILMMFLVSTVYGEQVTFSFWRNLVRNRQVIDQHEYTEPMSLYPVENASRCCTVQPCQAVTLVRGGEIVARGEVGDIFAALVPRAGDDRIVFFDVAGLPDTVGVLTGPPPFPKPWDRMYDMYVVGDVSLKKYVPLARAWSQDTNLVDVVTKAIADRAIDRLCFREVLGDACNPLESLDPEAVAAVLRSEAELTEYSVVLAKGEVLTIQSVRRPLGRWFHGFIIITGHRLSDTVLVRGVMDYFLIVDGVIHMILRDRRAGTGMWKYLVYRLKSDQAPELVHSDGSWST